MVGKRPPIMLVYVEMQDPIARAAQPWSIVVAEDAQAR